MEVVAEGVEDRDDWDLLQRTGCDLAQGAFVSRPMLPEKLPAWIEAWRERVRTSLPVGSVEHHPPAGHLFIASMKKEARAC